ncbi:hypothetical protein DPMN_052136 [Dreissena polymorpha]|uniref:Uncharacterized protein n=1 Tax=Dreissena polymorpha TaxID=45954 RepID=A0A9D4CKW4_DREPO|nr:hypothetical protein DPMN_052136 [Dreissena polymorpha]
MICVIQHSRPHMFTILAVSSFDIQSHDYIPRNGGFGMASHHRNHAKELNSNFWNWSHTLTLPYSGVV